MRVLLALDETSQSERTAAAIANWATAAAPEIHVLTVMNSPDVHETSATVGFTHALTPAGSVTGTSLGVTEPTARLAEDRSQALARTKSEHENALRAIVKKYLPTSDVTVHIDDSKDVAAAIVAAAARLQVDFVAMGGRHRRSLTTAIFGSVHEEVVGHCTVPVLVVGPAVTGP